MDSSLKLPSNTSTKATRQREQNTMSIYAGVASAPPVTVCCTLLTFSSFCHPSDLVKICWAFLLTSSLDVAMIIEKDVFLQMYWLLKATWWRTRRSWSMAIPQPLWKIVLPCCWLPCFLEKDAFLQIHSSLGNLIESKHIMEKYPYPSVAVKYSCVFLLIKLIESKNVMEQDYPSAPEKIGCWLPLLPLPCFPRICHNPPEIFQPKAALVGGNGRQKVCSARPAPSSPIRQHLEDVSSLVQPFSNRWDTGIIHVFSLSLS